MENELAAIVREATRVIVEHEYNRIEPESLAIEPGEPALVPLEKQLGIEVGLATPALAERVGWWSVDHEQEQVRTLLRREHNVSWSVPSLRKVTMTLRAGLPIVFGCVVWELETQLPLAKTPHGRAFLLRESVYARPLKWLANAGNAP